MKQKFTKMLLLFGAVALLSSTTPGCKSKVKDADVKTAVETAIAANPALQGLVVDVKDGIATVTGEVKDAASQTLAQTAIAAVKGVKSVQNNTTIAAPPPPPVPAITTDVQADALTKAVNDALKDFPTVKAAIANQIVTLTGEIGKDKVQKLMMGLNALKAMGLKSIDSKGLVKK